MTETVLWMIVPCHNEQEVLPTSSKLFLSKLDELIRAGTVSQHSRILFVDDGSTDATWQFIQKLSETNSRVRGIKFGRNCGHQIALMAGMAEARDVCDIAVTLDCDGQDDIDVLDEMIEKWRAGAQIVYGVRNDRSSDSFFKRTTAQLFYKLLTAMGVDTVYNHADYRLVSHEVLCELANYEETDLYLRGIFPLMGFESSTVTYVRHKRIGGKASYTPIKSMQLALSGIMGFTSAPLHIIWTVGIFIALLGIVGLIWVVVRWMQGQTVTGWASTTAIILFLGGIQTIALGIISQYLASTYMNVKHRPRWRIAERTSEKTN